MPEIYFQPGIVIFADAAGKAIYDLLSSSNQLENINALLKNAIGLIYRDESGDEPVYVYRQAKDEGEDAEIEEKASLKDAILELEKNLHPPSADEDYTILAALPAIYITGLPSSRYIVNDLRAERIWDGEINCLFLYEPSNQQQIIKEEWEEWKASQQVTSYKIFGNVSREVYKELGKSTFENEVAEALFASLSHFQIGPTADDIGKRIKDSVKSQLVVIRKRVLRQQAHTQVILKKRSRSHRVHNSRQSSLIEQLPWIPLAACQEDTFQGEQPEAYERLRNDVLQATKACFQHIEGVQNFSEKWVEHISKRHQEALETSTKANETKMREIWDYLEKDTLQSLRGAIKQIETDGSLWAIDFYKQLQSELEELLKKLHEQIKRENQTDTFHIRETSRRKGERIARSDKVQVPVMRKEELRSDIRERIYMIPSFHTYSVMATVVALMLALQVWLLVSALTGMLVLLLPLDFVLCLVSVVVGCWLYYKKTHIAPLEEKQEQMLSLYQDELVTRCEQFEDKQRLAFLKKVQENLSAPNVEMSFDETDSRELAARIEIEEEKR